MTIDNPIYIIFRQFALCMAFVVTLQAADYYVSSDGNDANAGTQASPWRTLSKVSNSSLLPGDRVLLKGGDTFAGPLNAFWSGTALAPIEISKYGTERPIIRAYGADDRAIFLYNASHLIFRDLTLVGPGIATSTKAGLESWTDTRVHGISLYGIDVSGFSIGVMIGSWATGTGIDGLLVDGCSMHDNKNYGMWSYGKTVTDHANFIIRRSIAYGNVGDGAAASHTGSGICINGVTNCLIEKCAAYNNGNPGGGGIGIWFYGVSNGTIQYCEAYENKAPIISDGGGFDLDGGVADSRIQYCYSHDNDGAGYLLWQYSGATVDYQAHTNNVVRYNISKNDARRRGYGGITVGGSEISNLHIYNNSIYCATTTTDSSDPTCITIDGAYSTGVKIWNNVLVAANGRSLVKTWSTTTTAKALFQNNIYHAMPGTPFSIRWNNTTYTSLSDWRASGQEKNGAVSMGIQADPGLASPAAAPTLATNLADCETLDSKIKAMINFTPTVDSPVIDAALDLTSPSWGSLNVGEHDLLGTPLPQGSGYELGAVEIIPYASWAGIYTGFTDTNFFSDPDGDGVNNFSEFAFGLDPTKGSSSNPIASALDKSTHSFRYTRFANSGLIYTVWTSTDLVTWSGPIAVSEVAGDSISGVETVVVTLNVPPSVSTLFVRVRATSPT